MALPEIYSWLDKLIKKGAFYRDIMVDVYTSIGFIEDVKVFGDETEEFEARIDSGAKTSSIDKEVAERLGLGPSVDTKTIRNAHGKMERDVIETDIKIKDKRLKDVKFTVSDRSSMTYDVLIGRNVLKRGFIIDPRVTE